MGDIPYNILSPTHVGSYGSGLFEPVAPPNTASYGTSNEISYGWGTALGKILGRAKGFAGVGTIARYGTADVAFPMQFSNIPIVKVKVLALTGYDKVDWFQYYYNRLKTGRSLFEGRAINDNPDAFYSGNRIVTDAWERRESPFELVVTKGSFSLINDPFNNVLFGVVSGNLEAEFDLRGEQNIVYFWHAFGV